MNTQSEQIGELFGALAKAQGLIAGAAKDSANPFFKSKYADLASIWNACRDALSQNGLAVVQTIIVAEDGESYLSTTLGHSSGQWMRSFLSVKVKDGARNELQELGACLTYLRRYALAAIVGVAPDEDDDGNSGDNYQAKQKKQPQTEPQVALPDLTHGEVMEFVNEICPDCPDKLKTYIDEIVQKSNWDYRKTVDTFKKQKESCAKKFDAWLLENNK
jgi:hypothetical protein